MQNASVYARREWQDDKTWEEEMISKNISDRKDNIVILCLKQ
jgi:hypothetical protein